jgi:hypothetical protein
MNMMVGTGIIAFVNHFRDPEDSNPLCREISRKLPFVIAFTVNFGVAPLLFLQVLYGHFMYTSSVLMANFWLFIIALIITGYYLAYIYNYKYDSLGINRVFVTGFSVTALLLIGFLMSNNFTMLQRPDSWVRYFDNPTGTLLNLGDPTLFPRYLHFMTAAVAIGGLSIALYYEYLHKRGDETAKRWVQHGCNWFGTATLVNFAFGLWFLGSLPDYVVNVKSFNGILIALFVVTVVILGILSVIYSYQGRVMGVLYTALPTVFIMIMVRDLVRAAYLKPYFSFSDLVVDPQYSPLFLFLLFFIGGIVLVGWMIKLAWQSFDHKEAS